MEVHVLGAMDVLSFVSWRATSLLLFTAVTRATLSVHILNESPVHVIPGSNLLLRARFYSTTSDPTDPTDPTDPIDPINPTDPTDPTDPATGPIPAVTWERQAETGPAPDRLLLATCPAGGLGGCAGTGPSVRAGAGRDESTLQISGYEWADGGDYIVTVTQQDGNKTSARCIVREYEAVHHVSVSINTSHSVLVCAEAWGTEPHFSWLHNRAAVTPGVGQVSRDGTTLRVTRSPVCGRFTCTVRNKLGYASATYAAGECDGEQSGTVAGAVCVLLLLMCGGLMGLWWRRYRRSSSSRQRLHENMDDDT